MNAKKYAGDPEGEVGEVKKLIAEEVAAGFYNIDVDTSTLVDLSQPTLEEQQRANFERCAEITAFIREREPEGVTVSVGARSARWATRTAPWKSSTPSCAAARPRWPGSAWRRG